VRAVAKHCVNADRNLMGRESSVGTASRVLPLYRLEWQIGDAKWRRHSSMLLGSPDGLRTRLVVYPLATRDSNDPALLVTRNKMSIVSHAPSVIGRDSREWMIGSFKLTADGRNSWKQLLDRGFPQVSASCGRQSAHFNLPRRHHRRPDRPRAQTERSSCAGCKASPYPYAMRSRLPCRRQLAATSNGAKARAMRSPRALHPCEFKVLVVTRQVLFAPTRGH